MAHECWDDSLLGVARTFQAVGVDSSQKFHWEIHVVEGFRQLCGRR